MIDATFTDIQIQAQLQKWMNENEKDFITALQVMGEKYVNKARSIRTYENRTSNLRNSIGYAIVKGNEILDFSLEEASEESEAEVNKTLGKITNATNNGLIHLIVFAGMNYALYVEGRGYDVITGSQPSKSEAVQLFNDLLAD